MQSYLCYFTRYSISFLNILSLIHVCCCIQDSISSHISILFHRCNCANCSPPPSAPITLNCGCQNFHSQTFCDFGKVSKPFFVEFVQICNFLAPKINSQKGVLHLSLRYEYPFRSLQKHVFNINWNKKCDFNWGEILPQIDIRLYRI